MKRLVIVAALAVAACNSGNTAKSTTDSTSTTATTPAMAPAADTSMKKDTGMKMNMDTATKAAGTMADTASKMMKKKKSM